MVNIMKIKDLFDPKKNIDRPIEKVISYAVDQEKRLKAEITEYVITKNIEDQFEQLLSKMQAAMEAGGENEVGVWVSGFYGSGKSSFTKYFGMAMDDRVKIEDLPFINYLQDRLHKPTTKALLTTVSKQFPAAVIMVDLATDTQAGAAMEDVTTVLYYTVLHLAGYSKTINVAYFERMLEKEGRYDEFLKHFEEVANSPWTKYQNNPLVVNRLLPQVAHEMYPELFDSGSSTAFSAQMKDFNITERDRVLEILDIVRKKTNKEYVLFIIDEVGQYVGARQELILKLDGLAKILKNDGEGKAWIIATAQQTLTEDDPKAAHNAPQLYKLKDRFPIAIELEAHDIREICYRRLLGKSPDGQSHLGEKFDQHGPELRQNTKLEDAKYYDVEFNRESFINLYPFLPAHFDILLNLLSALARSTGGYGLRSAIKIIQDILIDTESVGSAMAQMDVGGLATTVTLYDALEKEIRKAFPNYHEAVGKVAIRFPGESLHLDVAKTVAVLQSLNNMPISLQNIAALMHPSITSESRTENIKAIIDAFLQDGHVPFGEKDGTYSFLTERLNDIEREREKLPLRSVETRRIFNEALTEVFSPLPFTRLDGTFTVTAGLKIQDSSIARSLAGDKNPIQTIIDFILPTEYEDRKSDWLDESRQKNSENTVYLLGKINPELDDLVAEIYRSQEIIRRNRNQPDTEIKEYCNGQTDQAARKLQELQRKIKQNLEDGSFIFRGN